MTLAVTIYQKCGGIEGWMGCDQILENHPPEKIRIFEFIMTLLIAETTFKNISKPYL